MLLVSEEVLLKAWKGRLLLVLNAVIQLEISDLMEERNQQFFSSASLLVGYGHTILPAESQFLKSTTMLLNLNCEVHEFGLCYRKNNLK